MVALDSMLQGFLNLCKISQQDGLEVAIAYDKKVWARITAMVHSEHSDVDRNSILVRIDPGALKVEQDSSSSQHAQKKLRMPTQNGIYRSNLALLVVYSFPSPPPPLQRGPRGGHW